MYGQDHKNRKKCELMRMRVYECMQVQVPVPYRGNTQNKEEQMCLQKGLRTNLNQVGPRPSAPQPNQPPLERFSHPFLVVSGCIHLCTSLRTSKFSFEHMLPPSWSALKCYHWGFGIRIY